MHWLSHYSFQYVNNKGTDLYLYCLHATKSGLLTSQPISFKVIISKFMPSYPVCQEFFGTPSSPVISKKGSDKDEPLMLVNKIKIKLS